MKPVESGAANAAMLTIHNTPQNTIAIKIILKRPFIALPFSYPVRRQ